MERDKIEIEDKLKELQVGEGDVDRAEKVKMLEKEVNLAKEVRELLPLITICISQLSKKQLRSVIDKRKKTYNSSFTSNQLRKSGMEELQIRLSYSRSR